MNASSLEALILNLFSLDASMNKRLSNDMYEGMLIIYERGAWNAKACRPYFNIILPFMLFAFIFFSLSLKHKYIYLFKTQIYIYLFSSFLSSHLRILHANTILHILFVFYSQYSTLIANSYENTLRLFLFLSLPSNNLIKVHNLI